MLLGLWATRIHHITLHWRLVYLSILERLCLKFYIERPEYKSWTQTKYGGKQSLFQHIFSMYFNFKVQIECNVMWFIE